MTITGKATVLGLQLGLVSGTGQRAQFEVDDVILIVHNAVASDWQRLGLPGLQIMTMDFALAAARLTVYSAGKFLPLAINVYQSCMVTQCVDGWGGGGAVTTHDLTLGCRPSFMWFCVIQCMQAECLC